MDDPFDPPVNGGIMQITGSGSTLTLDGVTFSGGTAEQKGGAIYAISALTLNGTKFTFTGNQCTDNPFIFGGGAIYANSTLTFDGTGIYTFEKNTSATDGGAISANQTLAFKSTGTQVTGLSRRLNRSLTFPAAVFLLQLRFPAFIGNINTTDSLPKLL